MMPFWWACCTAWQTLTNSSSRCADGQLVLVAELGDGDAADQLHDEVGPAAGGLAAIEDLGDVRMVHQGQRLPLGLEAGDDLARVHARLEDLEGDLAADRLLLLGHEDDAEAAFADLLQQLVRADDRARAFANRRPIDRGGRTDGGRLQEAARAVRALPGELPRPGATPHPRTGFRHVGHDAPSELLAPRPP